MNWIESLILGLLQGLTEFLPVSSSGHLQIGAALFGTDPEENLLFAVVVHAATVMSTLVVLHKEVGILLKGLFSFRWNEETQYIAKIAISMIPVGLIGLFLKEYVEQIFGSSLALVAVMLLVTALFLLFAQYAQPRPKEKIGYKDAFIIGLGQALAILPGLSRSGTTIATGLLLGNKRESVARFSFLMVIIPVLGEAFLDLIKGDFTSGTALSPLTLLIGFLSAFVAGAFACRWMIQLVNRGKLNYFAYYCIAASLFAFVLTIIGK